jgi:3'(2'), 5'-bisphosphate nucleotidase
MKESIFYASILAALEAGKAIMEVYNNPFKVEYKADNSPLTIADLKAHQIISESLQKYGIPLLSEEGSKIPFTVRSKWDEYWLVDPIDGTKEFVKRNGDFTVNVALIRDHIPVAGVIYAPVKDMIYFAFHSMGSFRVTGSKYWQSGPANLSELIRVSDMLPIPREDDTYTVVASKSHQNPDTELFIRNIAEKKGEIKYLQVGSSLKFCSIAEGSADLYPRLGPTMEWDTAAGHAIATYAGCTIRQIEDDIPLMYNKESLLNPWFTVFREDGKT